MSSLWIRWGLAAAVACCAVGLCWTFANSQLPAAEADDLKDHKEATQTLGGDTRYLTSVSTDKPIYRGGEKVYVRGVLLNAANHKPLPEGQSANATIEIKGPKGDVVAGGNTQAQDSVWGFAWDVPAEQAGGEYTLHVTYPWDGHAPAERKFDIRAYRAPRLKSQITFLRDGYGPGDHVSATLDVKRAEGGAPEGAKVNVIARVDGMEIKGPTGRVDAKGLCTVTFDLPREIPRGEGTLALVIEDGGVIETASKTIPILLQTVDLQVFPEGGDLIAGYKNRVYVQARQPNGKPADLVGKLMSKEILMPGTVTEFRTEHEGRGRFEFIPDANKEYYLTITEPAGIKTQYPLPKAKTEGALIHSDKDVFEKGQPVTVKVGCTSKAFRVALSKREVEASAFKVDLSKHQDIKAGAMHPITFDVPADVDGVLAVTVWDDKGVPIAERLVFRKPANPLNISITPDKKAYVPGDNTKLTVKTTDQDGKPVSAVVGVTVTDDSVLEMIEKREQAPRLPVMLFLEPEVKDLADAHVYLDAKNPKAALATDLLLATQGWRRFALMDIAKFIEAQGDGARRVLALKIQSRVEEERALQMAGVAEGAMEDGMGGGMVRPKGMMMRKFDAMPAMRGAVPPAAPMAMPAAPMQAPAPMLAAKPMAQAALAPAEAGAPARMPLLQKEMQEPMAGEGAKLQNAIMVQDRRARAKMIAGKDQFAAQLSNLVVVREFAHQVRPDRKPTDRVDFAETIYWNAGVKTDANTGEATIAFGLNDSVTTFRVFADAYAGDGGIGADNAAVEAVQPFYAEAKLPLEVTAEDRILLPVSLVNATASTLAGADAKVNLKGDFKLATLEKGSADIGALERVRWLQPINVGYGTGLKDFTLTARAGSYEDNVTRKLSVKPKGFPIETAFGGMLAPGKPVVHTITIPRDVVSGSLASNTAVYPTPLANLSEALERMIQDPCGCFEQTSSTSYPLTMAQQYFLSHTGVDPKMVETARQKLDAGYKRLVGFWCPDRGYEWFGENPGHEALTAFGLLHFTDMSQVREVDQNMMASTRAWLLKQKDGQGGFTRKRRALHTWIEDKDCSNAYILWSLLESGQPASELKPELDSLKTAAAASQNNYVVALAANALYLAGDKANAKKLADRLAARQKPDGSVDGVKSSIVGSGGESLEVEGTALATLAWLREPSYAGNVEKSIKYLADSCKAGRYGSTQATVLALRAIVTYDKQRARPKAPGKVRLFVDGQSIGDWADFDKSTQGAIKLPDLSELLTPGEHKLELRMEGGGEMPYSMAVKYNTLTPASSRECKLDITVKLAQDKVVEGSSTEANVTVTNKTKDVVPTAVAIVGLPGGLEPRHDQLKELVKKGKIDAYEVLGREVVLYWRTLAADARMDVPLSLIAAVPGTYTGPASRAYLYYTDEHKKWVDGTHVEITAK
jgi:alpha-2-macroglobulin-like protein